MNGRISDEGRAARANRRALVYDCDGVPLNIGRAILWYVGQYPGCHKSEITKALASRTTATYRQVYMSVVYAFIYGIGSRGHGRLMVTPEGRVYLNTRQPYIINVPDSPSPFDDANYLTHEQVFARLRESMLAAVPITREASVKTEAT